MDNVTFFTDELNGLVHAIIDRGNNEFTSMLKSTYDEMIAAQSTPIVVKDEEQFYQLTIFMATIRELTSPNGWPAGEDRKALGIESFTVPGTSIKFACAKAVAPLLVNFAKEFNDLVEPIDIGQLDDWGYAFRMTRGSDKVLSNHSSGTAIDLNAIKHPLGKSNTFNKHQRNTINLLITKYGLTWGGNYKRRKDDMHFEIALDQNKVKQKIKELGLK